MAAQEVAGVAAAVACVVVVIAAAVVELERKILI